MHTFFFFFLFIIIIIIFFKTKIQVFTEIICYYIIYVKLKVSKLVERRAVI
nr:MAG TPA: hypothetical protein [Caudoviricetes sp.]